MTWSIIAYAVCCATIPAITLPSSQHARLMSFYVISFFLGLAFGSVYSRFQACTWRLIPPRADIANAMGFAAVAKCAGAGSGNFVAGLILDSFRGFKGQMGQGYGYTGYILLAWVSAFCVFISAGIIMSLARQRRTV